MTIDHILNTVFHAATWRAMHGVAPHVAFALAVVVAIIGVYLSSRR